MTVWLLQLSLCVLTVIQLTSSQSTYDVTQQDNDVTSCAGTAQVLSQLVMAVSQLQQKVDALSGNRDTNSRAKGTCTRTSILYSQQGASVI